MCWNSTIDFNSIPDTKRIIAIIEFFAFIKGKKQRSIRFEGKKRDFLKNNFASHNVLSNNVRNFYLNILETWTSL